MTTTKPPGNTGVPPLPGVTSRPAEARRTAEVDGARILDQLRIGHRETVLARVAEVSRQGQAPAELRLDIRGQTLGVQAAVGQTELTPGDWIRVLRSGNELQLLVDATGARCPLFEALGFGQVTVLKSAQALGLVCHLKNTKTKEETQVHEIDERFSTRSR